MIILIDADSIVYASCFNVETTSEAKTKFESYIYNICDSIEEAMGKPADKVRIFHGQTEKNFRKSIRSDYKANRGSLKPDFFEEVSAFAKFFFEAEMASNGLEIDDLVSMEWKRLTDEGKEVVIASIDKDFLQLPAYIYSWVGKRQGLVKVSEEEALKNFYTQMITGDSVDNVNYLKGKGPKFAQVYLGQCKTEFEYLSKVYRLFKQEYGTNAKDKYIECYRLLKIG